MMVATDKLSILRINWEGVEERDYSLDLRRIPFSINQQVHYGKLNCYTHTHTHFYEVYSSLISLKCFTCDR